MSKVDKSKELLEEKIRRLEKEAKEQKKENLELRKKYEAQKAKNEVLEKVKSFMSNGWHEGKDE